MADLVLKNVDQVLIWSLEQRAKQFGSTIEAEAIHALNAAREQSAALDAFLSLSGQGDDVDGREPGTAAAQRLSLPANRSNNVPDNDARTLQARQAALASAYPDEYVVLCGERVLVHTPNKDDAYAHYDAAFDGAGGLEPIVVAPGALRRLGPPVVRGRAVSGPAGTKR